MNRYFVYFSLNTRSSSFHLYSISAELVVKEDTLHKSYLTIYYLYSHHQKHVANAWHELEENWRVFADNYGSKWNSRHTFPRICMCNFHQMKGNTASASIHVSGSDSNWRLWTHVIQGSSNKPTCKRRYWLHWGERECWWSLGKVERAYCFLPVMPGNRSIVRLLFSDIVWRNQWQPSNFCQVIKYIPLSFFPPNLNILGFVPRGAPESLNGPNTPFHQFTVTLIVWLVSLEEIYV